MKINRKELADLLQIQMMYEKIDEIYSSFSAELQEQLNEIHNYEGSLGYCTRWGLQAVDDILEDYENGKKPILEEFKDYCSKMNYELSNKYNECHLDKCIVVDLTSNSYRDDSNMYGYAYSFLIDEYPEWFENCQTIEDCDAVLIEKHAGVPFNDYLEDEKSNLMYGVADLSGVVIIEVKAVADSLVVNILEQKNIGELLTSDCDEWMCYVNPARAEFCKMEVGPNGKTYTEYRELTCDKEKFEDILKNAKQGDLAELVSRYSESIAPRVAEVYDWNLEELTEIEGSLKKLKQQGYEPDKIHEIRKMVAFHGLSVDEAKFYTDTKSSLDERMKEAELDKACASKRTFAGKGNTKITPGEHDME